MRIIFKYYNMQFLYLKITLEFTYNSLNITLTATFLSLQIDIEILFT